MCAKPMGPIYRANQVDIFHLTRADERRVRADLRADHAQRLAENARRQRELEARACKGHGLKR